MAIKTITPPAVEPVTLAEVKAQLRIDTDDEKALLEGYIQAAREDCEDFAGRSFVLREVEYILDRFPAHDRIMLPRPPVAEVLSVEYRDKDGAWHELDSSHWLPALSEPPAVILARGKSWPRSELYLAEAVRVTYLSGYEAKVTDVEHKAEAVGEGDDEETIFTLKNTPVKSVTMFVDGREVEGWEVDLETGTVEFQIAPGEGSDITADYVQIVTDPRGNIPWAIKAAVLQTAGTYYEYRESVAGRGHVPMKIPGTAESLLWKNRFFFNSEVNA